MGNVLDTILIEEIVETPTTINTDFNSDSIDISWREAEFSVQLIYGNGSSVDMDLQLEVSNDNVNFSVMETQNVTDDDGSHIWDVKGTGTNYLRVSIIVNAGSMDLQSVTYKAKRRH